MRSSEIRYFATLLSSLTIQAARAATPDQVTAAGKALEDAYIDIFSLLSHDAMGGHEALVADMLQRVDADGIVSA